MAGVRKGSRSERRGAHRTDPHVALDRSPMRPRDTLDPKEKHLAEIQELAHLLDNSIRIPLINYRVGIDALVGLVPVVGDFTAFGLAGWIIYRAARMGAPKGLLAKMLANSLGDTLVGSIPGLGTIVDFTWKSNSRNLRMLERFLSEDR